MNECAYGQPDGKPVSGWHCIECAKSGLKLLRQFREAVDRGYYDEAGYTAAERRAIERKAKL